MMEPILIVEDDSELRRFLSDALASSGYRPIEASTSEEGRELLLQVKPVAILLDLGLPDGDGLALLRTVREHLATPVIILSARDRESDKVAALDAGADDYLTKPFSTPELLARIRVAMRRSRGPITANDPIVVSGPIRMDHERHEVTVDGTPVKLTPIEFRLLSTLARHAGKVMTHKALLAEVWGPGKESETHYLRVHTAALRRKIERDPARPRWLTTEPGIGYRLRDD